MTASRSFKKRVEELESLSRSGQLEKAVTAYRACKAEFPEKIKQIDCDALHSAVIYGHADTVMALIAAGADVNAANKFKQTALSFSVENELVDLVSLLIRAGADVNATDNWGCSLLYRFCATQSMQKNDQQMAMLLLDEGADPNFSLKTTGCSCLQKAIIHANFDLANALMDKGADIHAVCDLGAGPRTALHFAAEADAKDIVITLIRMGANMFTPKDSNHWPINIANEKKSVGSVMALIAAGAQPGRAGHLLQGVFTVDSGSGQRFLVDRLSASFYTGDAGLIAKALDEDADTQTLAKRVNDSVQWNMTRGFTQGLPLAQSLAASKFARLALGEIFHTTKFPEISHNPKC